jgi:hypothetical protein
MTQPESWGVSIPVNFVPKPIRRSTRNKSEHRGCPIPAASVAASKGMTNSRQSLPLPFFLSCPQAIRCSCQIKQKRVPLVSTLRPGNHKSQPVLSFALLSSPKGICCCNQAHLLGKYIPQSLQNCLQSCRIHCPASLDEPGLIHSSYLVQQYQT